MQFDWDESKNQKNVTKHGVCFEDAIPVFFDEKALSFEDNRHNYKDGQRMIIIGANTIDLLYVAYADIEEDVIRIISVRPAEPCDIKRYQRGY